MVIVDPRAGSGDLEPALRSLGVPVEVSTLDFGDVQIVGRGPEDRPVLVGVEIKKLGDFLQSFNDDRFLGHQLPGLRKSYEVAYLLLEGIWTSDEDGHLLTFKAGHISDPPWGGPWPYMALVERLQTLENRVGLRLAYTGNRRGTAAWLAATHRWWSKAWNKHESHLVVRSKELENENPLIEWVATTKMRVVAALAKGIGVHRAEAASRHFLSVKAMMLAGAKEWQKVEGIGKKLAAELVAAIEREER